MSVLHLTETGLMDVEVVAADIACCWSEGMEQWTLQLEEFGWDAFRMAPPILVPGGSSTAVGSPVGPL